MRINKSDKDKEINTCYARYAFFTGEASKIARQLAFAEGVIFWTLYLTMHCKPKLLLTFFYSALIIFFVIDLIQYLYGAYLFHSEAKMMIKTNKANVGKTIKFTIGDSLANKIEKFYISKILFLILSTILLIVMFTIFTI